MEDCKACRAPVGFHSFLDPHPFTVPPSHRANSTALAPEVHSADSALVRDAFGGPSLQAKTSDGLAGLAVETAELTVRDCDPPLDVVDTAMARYSRRQPNCLAVGISNGIRGAVVGSVFGGAMGLSTAVQSGYRGTAAATYAGMGAMRNAAGFASWTALYGSSRCGLIRARGTHDLLNPTVAGGFTGALLTLISVRGYWRYNQSSILANAAGSAMVAVMFEALNYF